MPHVLVVEDDTASRLLFAAVMRHHGLECIPVADGAAAVEALKHATIDAVLLDLVLPGMSGFQVLREIERLRPELVAGVVVCSALPERELRNSSELCGVAAIVPKPPDIEMLVHAVRAAARVPA